jgi:hypothetical protein
MSFSFLVKSKYDSSPVRRFGAAGLGALASVLALTVVTFASPARAQEDSGPEPQGPRHFGADRTFGIGPSLGMANGAGGMIALGMPPGTVPASLLVTGAYNPIEIWGKAHDGGRVTVDSYSSWQVGGDIELQAWHAGTRYDFGPLAGYRYNSVLGHGAGAGFALHADLSAETVVFFSIEMVAYPQAQSRLASVQYPTDRDAILPWLEGGANVGLLFYP